MENVITRIKNYVRIINSAIADNAFLDFIVRDVVDRSLVYMNRTHLKVQYEKDILDDTVEEEDYVLPLPVELERTLAGAVIGVYKTVETRNSATKGAVKSISDHGQSISYSDQIANFMSTANDQEVFGGATALMNNYRLGKVLTNERTY